MRPHKAAFSNSEETANVGNKIRTVNFPVSNQNRRVFSFIIFHVSPVLAFPISSKIIHPSWRSQKLNIFKVRCGGEKKPANKNNDDPHLKENKYHSIGKNRRHETCLCFVLLSKP